MFAGLYRYRRRGLLGREQVKRSYIIQLFIHGYMSLKFTGELKACLRNYLEGGRWQQLSQTIV